MGRTKAGPAGRFGPRYGTKARKLIAEVERKQRGWHRCPSCGSAGVRRFSTGIWRCRRCGTKFAGAAYVPSISAFRPSHAEAPGKERGKEGGNV